LGRLLPVGSRLVHNGCLSKDMGIPSEPSSTPVRIRVATATYDGLPAFHEEQKLRRPRYLDCIPSRDEELIVKRCRRCNEKGHFRDKCTSVMPAPAHCPDRQVDVRKVKAGPPKRMKRKRMYMVLTT